VKVAAKTDIGRIRDVNEDSYCAFDLAPLWGGRIFAVADGMGGYDGGEVASSLAIMTLHDHLRQALEAWKAAAPEEQTPALVSSAGSPGSPPEPDLEQMLADAFAAADAAIQEETRKRPGIKGMGTTLTAVLAGGGRLWLAHAGDSRAYLMNGGALRQISEDHSLVGEMMKNGTLTEAEAMVHPQRNILTNALGAGGDTHVDVSVLPYHPGNRLVLCTDGLTGSVSSAEMAGLLSSREPAEAAEALVALANERGGYDNITVLVVELS